MINTNNKNIIRFVAFILCIGLVCSGMVFGFSEAVNPEVIEEGTAHSLRKDIYLNGQHLNNWNLNRPILEMDDTIYIPVLTDGNIDIKANDTLTYDFQDFKVTAGYHLTIGDTEAKRRDVLVVDGLGEYYSLDFVDRLDKLDSCTSIGGLYLSTIGIPASWYMENDPNVSYILGYATYMMHVNKDLSLKEAAGLEYMFRHVAQTTKFVNENLLMGVARVESNYHPNIGTNAAGLMQILYKYAYANGYTKEGILEPHANIHYGATILSNCYATYRDQTLALLSYNMGSVIVRNKIEAGEELITSYAEAVYNSENSLSAWIGSHKYSRQFIEYIGQ